MAINTSEILIPKLLFGGNAEKDIELDADIPEKCPDILRLIRVECTPFDESVSIEGEKAVVSGKAVFDLLYETERKSRICFCSFTRDYQIPFSVRGSAEQNTSASAETYCSRIECRVITPRKVSIRSLLGCDITVEGETVVSAVNAEDGGGVFFRKATVGFEGRTETKREAKSISEPLPLISGEKNIGDIVYGSVTLSSPQTSVTGGRAELRATATIRTLCESEEREGEYFPVVKTMPVAIDITDEMLAEHKHMSFRQSIENAEFRPELDQYGESRILRAQFDVKTVYSVSEPKAYTVATDMFEEGYDIAPEKAEVNVRREVVSAEKSFTVEMPASPFEPTPITVYEATARPRKAVCEPTDGGVRVRGGFTVSLTAMTENGLYSQDSDLPFEQFLPLDTAKGGEYTASVTAADVIPTLHADGSVSARVVCSAAVAVFAEESIGFIGGVASRTESGAKKPAGVTFFYPARGEKLWDIAKRYRTDPERLLAANRDCFDEQSLSATGGLPVQVTRL